eukprot:COSAG06_NODE_1940_length_8023_cov_11.932988_1_plen_33_part_10
MARLAVARGRLRVKTSTLETAWLRTLYQGSFTE